VGLVGGIFGGVGTVLGLFGLILLFVCFSELGSNPIGGIILLLGVGFTGSGVSCCTLSTSSRRTSQPGNSRSGGGSRRS
jgi:hypothetical protein